jgi:putative oxidoreductase
VAGIPKLENTTINQGYFGGLGLPPELVLPIALLEGIVGIFLIAGALTRITAAIFMIEMIGATTVVWLSQGFAGGPLLKQAAMITSSLLMAISISLLLTGPGRLSIEWNVLRRQVFPSGKYIIQDNVM